VHFDHGERHRLDHVVDGHGGEAQAGGVDDGAVHVVDVFLERVDDDGFVIRLEDRETLISFATTAIRAFI
jgi:hypothetical protein